MTAVTLIGVYAADGGLRGELAYVVGHLLGRAECSLCDITHSPVRRKKSWDAMVGRLAEDGVSVVLRHRNELDPPEESAAREAGHPVVLVTGDGGPTPLLSAETLAAAGGSVPAFEAAVRAALATHPRTRGSFAPPA